MRLPLCSLVLATLLLCQGCVVQCYKRPGGPFSFTASFLMNDQLKKMAVDRMGKASSTGFTADGVNAEVDNEALKSVVEGAVKGALGIP